MFYRVKRHPFVVKAFFRHSLVLTYAYPKTLLEPLLPPGLFLDTYNNYGFLAIAMVQTEQLRPAVFPKWFGQRFFLCGYRLFCRYTLSSGKTLRGLKILRSDTDSYRMSLLGNFFTHYGYRKSTVTFQESGKTLCVSIKTHQKEADLEVIADLNETPSSLPQDSPFRTIKEAKHFAGPLPFTFDYERQTHSLLRVMGVRQNWKPKPVSVKITKNTFLEKAPFSQETPILANAFHLQNVPYRWEKGQREVLIENHKSK